MQKNFCARCFALYLTVDCVTRDKSGDDQLLSILFRWYLGGFCVLEGLVIFILIPVQINWQKSSVPFRTSNGFHYAKLFVPPTSWFLNVFVLWLSRQKVSRVRQCELHTPQPARSEHRTMAHGGQSNESIRCSAAAVFQAKLVYYVLQGLKVRKPTESSSRRRAMDTIKNGIVAVGSSRIDESWDLWQRNRSIRQLGSNSVSVDSKVTCGARPWIWTKSRTRTASWQSARLTLTAESRVFNHASLQLFAPN
jgi:hypothetical protein